MDSSLWKCFVPILIFAAAFYVALNTVFPKYDDERHKLCDKQIQEAQCDWMTLDVPLKLDLHKLKHGIAKTFECFNNPGLAVSVVKNGKTILSQGFGVTSPSKGTKVTSKTLFSIASLTKAFTAALLLDVIAKNGRMSFIHLFATMRSIDTPLQLAFLNVKLSSTIKNVVGSWFSFNDSQRTEYATIEDLLAHRLKVPGNDAFRFNPDIDRHQLLKRIKFFESKSEFRVKGIYCSTNYIMAAAITELLGNKRWEELMKHTIFQPLGMTSSNFAADVNFDDLDVAPPYSTFNGQVGDLDPAFTRQWNNRCGSGCIFSTADDMANWMTFHLSKGKDRHGHQVFQKSSVNDLHSPRTLLPSSDLSLAHIPEFPITQSVDIYALGWRVGYYRGYQIVSHTGSTPGYASMMTLVPSENVGVFVVMNGDDDHNYYRMSLQDYIMDAVLGLEPWLNTSTVCTFPQPWRPRQTSQLPVYDVGLKPIRSWTEYVGVYRNDGYGDIIVGFDATFGLTARFGFGFWQFHPQRTKDVFYGKGLDVTKFYDIDFVVFTASSNTGWINGMIVKGFNRSIPPVFHKDASPVDSVN